MQLAPQEIRTFFVTSVTSSFHILLMLVQNAPLEKAVQ